MNKYLLLKFSFCLMMLFSCQEAKKTLSKKKTTFLSSDTTFKIGENKFNYANISYYKNSYNMDFYNEKYFDKSKNYWGASCKFRNDGVLIEKSNLNFFNELESYYFDENNSLSQISKYVKDTEHGNEYCLQDFIVFNNCLVDEKKSNFIDVKILQTKEDKVLLEIKYVSGHKFISGEIYSGKLVESRKDAKKLNKMIMKSPNEQLWVSKNDFIYDDYYIEFTVFIHRDIKSGIDGHVITVPKGQKEFVQFFIVRRLLESPM